MRRVLKYPLDDPGGTPVPVNYDAPVRLVDVQFTTPTVWIEVDDAEVVPAVPRSFIWLGTGHPVPSGVTHVGSAFDKASGLVWHVYEATHA